MKNFPIISFLFPPRMRSGRTLTDKRMEAIALLLLLMLWGMTVYFYHVLLGQIPVNFDIHGHVDRYGSKSALFLISGIFTFISLILGVCAYHPRLINLPVAVRTPFQRMLACRMARTCNLVLPFLYAGILLRMAAPALGFSPNLPVILNLSAVILLLIVIAFYGILITRAGRNT